MSSVLEVRNITKIYGNKFAVNNLSFTVKEGEIFGLLGPTSSGKSSVIRMICGLVKMTKGDIFINNISYKKQFEKAISYVGGFIGLPKMYGYMTGYDNIKHFLKLRNIETKTISKYARIVGIEQYLNQKVSKYDTGTRQKLCIALSLMHNPKLLVIDDPFTGLDAKSIKEVQDLLKLLAKQEKLSIIISSRMLGQMEKICDTIGIINNGTMLECKSIVQLKTTVEDSQKLRFTVDFPNLAGKIIINEFKYKVQIAGNSAIVYTTEENIKKISQRLNDYKLSIFKIETVSKSLEEIFKEILENKAIGRSWINDYN